MTKTQFESFCEMYFPRPLAVLMLVFRDYFVFTIEPIDTGRQDVSFFFSFLLKTIVETEKEGA